MSGRRIEVSATQVIASLLAAVTGAIAASFLGVAGTIIGTALMSVASTAIAAIYKGGLISSKERLRAAADAARVSPRVSSHLPSRIRVTESGEDLSRAVTREERSRAATRDDRPGAPTRQELSRAAATRRDRLTGPDDETQILPAVAFSPHRWDDTDRANGLTRPADGATQIAGRPGHDAPEGSPDDGATAALPGPALGPGGTRAGDAAGGPARPDEPAGEGASDDGGAGGPDGGAGDGARWSRRRLLVLAGVALGVFLLAMAGITAFEAVAGKPLNALVGGGHGSGTTIGSIVGGSGSHTAPRHTGPARPSQGTSPTPRASASPTPTPTPSQSPTPSPTPTASPTPSASPASSAAVTPGAAASPARAPASGSGP